MSKSLGNGIDPLEMAEQVRRRRPALQPGHRQLPRQRHALLHRAVRGHAQLRQQDLERQPLPDDEPDHRRQCQLPEQLELEDKWILSKLNAVIREVTENMDHYELGVAAQKLYDFIWDDYCDWYIELTKARLQGEDQDSQGAGPAGAVLCAHPDAQAAPPLHALHHRGDLAGPAPRGGTFLMLQSWPEYRRRAGLPRRRRRPWS